MSQAIADQLRISPGRCPCRQRGEVVDGKAASGIDPVQQGGTVVVFLHPGAIRFCDLVVDPCERTAFRPRDDLRRLPEHTVSGLGPRRGPGNEGLLGQSQDWGDEGVGFLLPRCRPDQVEGERAQRWAVIRVEPHTQRLHGLVRQPSLSQPAAAQRPPTEASAIGVSHIPPAAGVAWRHMDSAVRPRPPAALGAPAHPPLACVARYRPMTRPPSETVWY